MKRFLTDFFSDDDGAVTVDFVVLTAAVCLLGFSVVTAIAGSTTDLANKVSDKVENTPI